MLAPMMPLRQALRAIWTRPQLSLVAVALLALGIGANTTLFALADAVMFRPFPFARRAPVPSSWRRKWSTSD